MREGAYQSDSDKKDVIIIIIIIIIGGFIFSVIRLQTRIIVHWDSIFNFLYNLSLFSYFYLYYSIFIIGIMMVSPPYSIVQYSIAQDRSSRNANLHPSVRSFVCVCVHLSRTVNLHLSGSERNQSTQRAIIKLS